jgi:predicted nucleic acid-binding protein
VILVDTNVLLDIAGDDMNWAGWSAGALQAAALEGPLLINSVIYAELSARYLTIENLENFVEQAGLEIDEIPGSALFLARKAFGNYRRAGGVRTGVLPDFFIGAHAAVMNIAVLTRDIGKYRTYFPDVELRTPANPD